jgi:hypothetical protein
LITSQLDERVDRGRHAQEPVGQDRTPDDRRRFELHEVGDITPLANPGIVDEIRHRARGRSARGEVPRERSDEEEQEVASLLAPLGPGQGGRSETRYDEGRGGSRLRRASTFLLVKDQASAVGELAERDGRLGITTKSAGVPALERPSRSRR